MSESSSSKPEVGLSAEQHRLVTLAQSLVARPDAEQQRPQYKYRTTTKREKTGVLLGRVIDRSRLAETPRDGFYEKVQALTQRRVLALRGLEAEDFPDGTWGGGVYLSQSIVTNVDTHQATDQLSIFAQGTVNNPRATSELGAYSEAIAWEIDLLQPLQPEVLAKAALELEQAARKYPHTT